MTSNVTKMGGAEDRKVTTGDGGIDGQSEHPLGVTGQLEVDGDDDADVTHPKAAGKMPASKHVTGTGASKTPRKLAAKKQVTLGGDVEVNEHGYNEEKAGDILKPTPKKRGPKPKKIVGEVENDDAELEVGIGPVTPIKKRALKAKKESTGGELGLSATGPSKKHASLGEAGENDDETPSKKSRAAYVKIEKTKLPTSRSELTEADKLMIDLKKEGKTWAEVTLAVSILTGLQYGKSTLGVRYGKIMDALTEWKEGDVERMLFVRSKVLKDNEAAIAAFTKEIESKTWSQMAKAMVEVGADEYTGGAVEKAYGREKKEGFPHKSTVPLIMNKFPSAGGANNGGQSDHEGEDDGIEGDKIGKQSGGMGQVDNSGDMDAFGV